MSEITYLHVLTASTMLSNSDVWLHNPGIVQMIENHPLGPGALGEVRGAHDQLATAVNRKRRLGQQVLDMTRRITAQDRDHDRFLRVLYHVLTSLAEATDNPAEAERYLTARDMLMPDGLAQTRFTYADEHGAVLEVLQRITPDIEALLLQTAIAGRPLMAIYQRWVGAGQQLGQLVKERTRIQSSMMQGNEGAPLHVRMARKEWLRVVRMFIAVVDIMNLPAHGWQTIFAPLQRDIDNALVAIQARADDTGDEVSQDAGGDEVPQDAGGAQNLTSSNEL